MKQTSMKYFTWFQLVSELCERSAESKKGSKVRLIYTAAVILLLNQQNSIGQRSEISIRKVPYPKVNKKK